MRDLPFIRPNPPRLSLLVSELEQIEASSTYSNYGPVNTRFERELTESLFNGSGHNVTVCNATIGLMLAIKEAVHRCARRGKYALMPSFTFAATGHAALWAGLTPLLCDIDARGWASSPSAEDELIAEYGDQIAVLVPYATFGIEIDLDRYDRVYRSLGIPTVVDAAASLGTKPAGSANFGASFEQAVVYSMHATKTFSTGEGGVVFSEDPDIVKRIRDMGNFGFEHPRTASLPGLNSKLTEVGALIALHRLGDFSAIIQRRSELAAAYRSGLQRCSFQEHRCDTLAYQFFPILLDRTFAAQREAILGVLKARGIGAAKYFSPHLAQQSFFQEHARVADLAITEDVSSRVISLPLYEQMDESDIRYIAGALDEAIATVSSLEMSGRA